MKKGLIALATATTLMLPMTANAKHISYKEAGCNMTAYLIMNAMENKATVKPKIVHKSKAKRDDAPDVQDVKLLAHLIWNETGVLGEESLYYTGSVVLNRVKSPMYPDNLYDVIFQRGQYACTWDGNFYRKTPKKAYRIARWLLEHGSILPSDVVFQAEFVQGDGIYKQIGNTYYCYLRGAR